MQTEKRTNVELQRYFRYMLASFLCFLLFMPTNTMAGKADTGYRYLRLTALSGVSTYDAYFYEIEWMVGATAYPVPKKTSATASTVTATVDTGNAWKVFDGIRNSGLWTPNVTIYPYSITCDLGSGVSINPSEVKISIEWNARALSSFTCEGSNDKATWTNLYAKSGLTQDDWVRDATNSFVFPVPDVQAPTVPANLVASNIFQSGCTLSWDASTDNVAVASYEIFKDGVSVGTTTSTTLNVTGLSSSSTYAFTVKSKDTSGNISGASSPANVTTTAPDLTAPAKPTGLISSNITFSGFTLSWTASTDNVGVVLYEVFRGSTSCGTTTSTTLKITGLTASTDYSMTVIAKDAAGNASVASDPKLVTTLVYIPGATGFSEDFNDNKLTGWYLGSYGLSEQNQELKIVPVKNSVWDGFGFSFPEITIKNTPYVSLKIKSNFDFNLSMAVGKKNGKIDNYPLRIETIGIAGAQEVIASSEYQTYSFDYTGLTANTLDSISNLHFVLNPLTRDFGEAPNKEIYFDDIKIGDLASHTPAISSIQDQVFTVKASGNESRTVSFRNVTDGSTDKNAVTITASSSNPSCIPNPQVVYTSPKRSGSLVLNPILAAFGESVISVVVSAPNTSQKVMTFKVKVVANAAPSMKSLPDVLVRKGEKVTIALDQIDDGNPESTQNVKISGKSSNLAVIPSITVVHDSTAFTGTLSFTPAANTPAGTSATIKVRLKDNGGIASSGIDTANYTFNVNIFDEINHKPIFDSIPPKSVKALAGSYQLNLTGISDGDNNLQTLSFEVTASADTVITNLSVGNVVNGVAPINYNLTGKTGGTTITVKVTDNGGNAGNNGNQFTVKSFLLTAVPSPITGLIADYKPFIGNVGASGISNDQNNGTVEILADGTVHFSGTVMQQTFPSVYFTIGPLTGGKELDISANKYVSFKFKGASTNKIEAPDKKLLDMTKIFFRLVDNINPGAPGSGYNVSFMELNLPNDDAWHDIYLDFTGYFKKTKDGNQTDSTRITRLMLDINDLWFQQIKGDYYFKDLKLGDKADRPQVIPHPTINPVPNQIVYQGQLPKPILLTGISNGMGKLTADIVASSSKPALVSGINIGNIINGTALLKYTLNAASVDSAVVTVITNNTAVVNAVPDTISFKVFVMDTATVANSIVTIDFSKTYQTFAGMGTMLNNGNDPVQIQQIKDLNITLMRLTSTGEFEPVNDNSDPNVTNYSNFNRKALPTDLIRSINENTNCHKFFYTPWSPPNWMKQNKGANPDPATMWAGNNKLKPEMYEEFAEYLVAICKTIKEEAGVELYAISLQNEPTFNEPYASCQYTGAEFRDMMKIIGPRFEAENINTRIMMPEDIATMISWVTDKVDPVNADHEARKYLDIMAVHLYDPDGINVGGAGSSRWTDLLKIKKTTNAEGLWMTETSGFGNVWEGYWGKDYLSGNPQFFPGPLDFAGSMYTSFKAGNISGWTDFEGTGFKTLNDLAGSVFKNYSAYLNPGAVMVDAISTNKNILSLAFKNTDNSVTSILLNTSQKPVKVTLKGSGVPEVYRSFTTQNSAAFIEGAAVTKGAMVLPPRSITTLYHSAANLAPTVDQTGNLFIELSGGDQNISLSGIGYGADPVVQNVTSVTASSGNKEVATVTVNYTANASSASLKISPVAYGTTLITVKVKDDGGIAAGGIDSLVNQFYVTVMNGVNHPPTIDPVGPVTILEDADSLRINLTGISDGDLGTQQLQFAITSSNETLVRPRISYVKGANTASLIFKPVPNANGSSIFTIILTDNGGNAANNGNLTARLDIPVTVVSVNDAPTAVAILTSATIKVGAVKRFPITIGDGDPELIQTLSFEVQNANPDLVDTRIIDNLNNTLTLNVTGKAAGTANLTFVLQDNGGTENGGIDKVQILFVITVENVVGINETEISSISLYPNPAHDYVYLKLNNYPARKVVITDANGQIVLQQKVIAENDGCKLSIHDLPAGLYFINVYSENQSQAIKFIHQ
jgi:O-glycosyl hydrolase/chitodextrinase